MKISQVESGKAVFSKGGVEEKILPKDRPKGLVTTKARTGKALSRLEQGMAVAEAALANVPDVREEFVEEIKQKIKSGEYKIDGKEVAEMMLRRLSADRVR